MNDPEPDRYEIAQRTDGWQIPVTTLRLLDMLDDVIASIPGCKEGAHEWANEYIGDPPGPNRAMRWSTTRVECVECGQTAALTFDAPPAKATAPDHPWKRVSSTTELRDALLAGRAGSRDFVKLDTTMSLLYVTLRHLMNELDSEEG